MRGRRWRCWRTRSLVETASGRWTARGKAAEGGLCAWVAKCWKTLQLVEQLAVRGAW